MDKLKQWVVLTAVAALLIVAGGWFLLVSPKNGEAEALRAEAAAQMQANDVLEQKLKLLQAQAKELPQKQAVIARIGAQIPDNPSLPSLIRAMTAASAAAGVDFVSVTPEAPVLPVAAPVSPTAPAPASAQTTPPIGVPPAASGAAGSLATIPFSMTVVGDYFDTAQFLANLETLPRSLRVAELTVVPGLSPTAPKSAAAGALDGRSLSTTVKGRVFMAVNRPAPTVVVAPVAIPAK